MSNVRDDSLIDCSNGQHTAARIAATFLNQAMGLDLSEEDIGALERRTEGWIAGLQRDAESFIKSFTGSHRYVLDYLIEEVLEQQPESVRTTQRQQDLADRPIG